MNELLKLPSVDWWAVAPALAITLTACAVMLADLWPRLSRRGTAAALSLVGLIVTAVLSVYLWDADRSAFCTIEATADSAPYGCMLILDNFALFFNLVFVLITVITVLISFTYMEREDLENSEYYVLLLFSVAGLMLMASAGDLIIVFLGLELLSLPLYMLAGFSRLRLQSDESAVKYVLLGAFASGFLLYGIALMYGATETTNLAGIATAVAQDGFGTLLLIGMGLLIAGLGFKAALVPFHMWTPDVYEGAPTPVTAYMSVAAKTATFAALARVFVGAVPEAPVETVWVLGGVAAATMIVGNVAALVQNNIKRLLGYSSIAHAGYLLVGLVAASVATGETRGLAIQSLLFYSVAYSFMNLGAFGVVTFLGRRGEEFAAVSDYAGLARRRPWLAAMMALFMLSLAGVPPTVGFVGKFYLFGAAIDAGHAWLAIVGLLTSVVSAYYYLRVVYVMYMQGPSAEPAPLSHSALAATAVVVSAAAVLLLGLVPSILLDLSRASLGALIL